MTDPNVELQTPMTDGAVEIRSMERHLIDDPTVFMLEISIYPLPAGVPAELAEYIQGKVVEWLQAKGITDGSVLDLTAWGPTQ